MIEYRTRDWVHVVLRLRGTVLPRIVGRTAIAVAIALVAAYLKERRGIDLSVPVLVHSIVGVALGLLLVFRTNTSYDRYWEGRKLLGGMLNTCRDLARQTAACFPDTPHVRRRVSCYVVAMYACIRRYLRDEREWSELKDLLAEDELHELRRRRAPPLVVARWLSNLLASEANAGRLSEERLRRFDENLTVMVNLWGGAERIVKTPVPLAYAHHIKTFLTLFCFTVPFALLNSMGWFTSLGTAVVAFAMFGIDEIGLEIEDPFGYDENDLPLDAIGDMLAVDVAETAEPEAQRGTRYDARPGAAGKGQRGDDSRERSDDGKGRKSKRDAGREAAR
jgi:putative membrane protein